MYKNSKNTDDNDASTTVSDEIRIIRLITLPISIDKLKPTTTVTKKNIRRIT
jgi:hypothetical protein